MDIFTPEQQQLIDSLEVYAQAEIAKATLSPCRTSSTW